MTDGDAGMTREALEALIGRILDTETRETPPLAGEEGDWLYGSAGFTEPDEHGWMAPLPSAYVWVPRALVFWHIVMRVWGTRGRGSAERSATFAGALAGDRGRGESSLPGRDLGMFGKLELRCGVVEPISTRTDVSGSEKPVSSTTVTTFEFDGAVAEFSGATLPFRAGDEAVVAGQLARSGIFIAYAVALPRQRILLDRYSVSLVVFGGVFVALGAGVGIGTMPGALDWLPNIGPLVITLVLSLAFTCAGLGIISSALIARRARLMVQAASDRDRLKRMRQD